MPPTCWLAEFASVTAIGEPHFVQNFCPAFSTLPQFVQVAPIDLLSIAGATAATCVPHFVQNFCPGFNSFPQFVHFIIVYSKVYVNLILPSKIV
jgi:hypothetical protein